MSRRLHSALAVLLALAGCSGDVIDIQIALNMDEGSCPGPDPGVSWLPCGGFVGVWLVTEDGDTLDEHCVPFSPEPLTFDDLPILLEQVSFAGLESGDRVAVELAVYSDEQADSCVRFDPENFEGPMPAYYGVSEVFTVSKSGEPPVVSAACYDIAVEPCFEQPLQVTATVTSLETWEPVQAEQSVVSVSAGVVTQDGSYNEGGTLEAQGPEWSGQIFAAPLPDECLGVVVTSQEAQLPFLSCESQFLDVEYVMVNGYLAEANLVENVIAALGPEDPGSMGFGLGRVVNMENQPVGGVQFIPPEPGLTIQYLSPDMMSLNDESTADHGYFVVVADSPGCCHSLTDVEPPLSAEVYPFGLVPEMITVIPVRLEP